MSKQAKHLVVFSGAGMSAESGLKTFRDATLLYPLAGRDIRLGDSCELGSQLRPHIVWFGEAVPQMERAIAIAETADILIIVGTSLFVYPAAGLATCVPATAECYLINPEIPSHFDANGFTCIEERAGIALPKLIQKI